MVQKSTHHDNDYSTEQTIRKASTISLHSNNSQNSETLDPKDLFCYIYQGIKLTAGASYSYIAYSAQSFIFLLLVTLRIVDGSEVLLFMRTTVLLLTESQKE